jgi:hypothetical protein
MGNIKDADQDIRWALCTIKHQHDLKRNMSALNLKELGVFPCPDYERGGCLPHTCDNFKELKGLTHEQLWEQNSELVKGCPPYYINMLIDMAEEGTFRSSPLQGSELGCSYATSVDKKKKSPTVLTVVDGENLKEQ